MTTSDNKFTFVKLDDKASEHIAAPKYSYWNSVFKKFFSSKVAILTNPSIPLKTCILGYVFFNSNN